MVAMPGDVVRDKFMVGTVEITMGQFPTMTEFVEAVCTKCGLGGRTNCYRIPMHQALREDQDWAVHHRCPS